MFVQRCTKAQIREPWAGSSCRAHKETAIGREFLVCTTEHHSLSEFLEVRIHSIPQLGNRNPMEVRSKTYVPKNYANGERLPKNCYFKSSKLVRKFPSSPNWVSNPAAVTAGRFEARIVVEADILGVSKPQKGALVGLQLGWR